MYEPSVEVLYMGIIALAVFGIGGCFLLGLIGLVILPLIGFISTLLEFGKKDRSNNDENL